MNPTPAQLQALADDLRQLVYKLAKVDGSERGLYRGDVLNPFVLAIQSPEQTRADACLVVIQSMLTMQPGDSLTVDWHDQATHPSGSMATLTIRPDAPAGTYRP